MGGADSEQNAQLSRIDLEDREVVQRRAGHAHRVHDGSVSRRVEQIGLVFTVWVFQLIVSPIWLKHFRFGPFEWLWRSLSYWKRQPMRRATKDSSAPSGV